MYLTDGLVWAGCLTGMLVVIRGELTLHLHGSLAQKCSMSLQTCLSPPDRAAGMIYGAAFEV